MPDEHDDGLRQRIAEWINRTVFRPGCEVCDRPAAGTDGAGTPYCPEHNPLIDD